MALGTKFEIVSVRVTESLHNEVTTEQIYIENGCPRNLKTLKAKGFGYF